MADASYPPAFRQPEPHGNRLPPIPPAPTAGAGIPSFDLQDLNPRRLGEACRDWGLFRLSNHGIPAAFSAALLASSREILSLPFESKRARFTDSPISYFFGTPAVTQQVSSLNWVEGLHLSLSDLNPEPENPDPDLRFRCLMNEYGRHMARIARSIFDAMCVDLALDARRSASYLSEFDGTFRVYRYPCCGGDSDMHRGMNSHTDSSVLSILCQDEVGGLQILRDGDWLDIPPVPGTLVVNIGDMMQAISDDEYKSVEHRVLASTSRERMSLCYFAFPVEDGVIVSSKYRAFTYNEFKAKVQEDIKVTGFKVGLQRFRISDSGP